jgi:hypothetical protein
MGHDLDSVDINYVMHDVTIKYVTHHDWVMRYVVIMIMLQIPAKSRGIKMRLAIRKRVLSVHIELRAARSCLLRPQCIVNCRTYVNK